MFAAYPDDISAALSHPLRKQVIHFGIIMHFSSWLFIVLPDQQTIASCVQEWTPTGSGCNQLTEPLSVKSVEFPVW